MIQLTVNTPILLATQPVDFRKGIDGFVSLCQSVLQMSPRNGHYFVFINRSRTMIRLLSYDGQGYWLATKRLSKGHFQGWPDNAKIACHCPLLATELRSLLAGETLQPVALQPKAA